jgi:glycosyltransferase involved in cell wall biosynthesis
MKLLFVYQYCSLGGCETVLRNRLVGFRTLGLTPRVVLLRDLGGGDVFAGFDGVTYPCSADALGRIVETGSFDVVAVIDSPQVYPVLARARFGGTVVTEVHTNRIDNLQYLYGLTRTATRLIVAPSRYEVELILREFPSLRGGRIPIEVVPNPIDPELFRPVDVEVRHPRKLLGWVGRLEPEKNWRHFLEIAAALARVRDDVDFLAVGGWTVEDSVKREFLRAVKAFRLVDRLKWVSSVAYDRMPRFYALLAASGGCLVPTSVIEPFGMSVIEAMACGCPVAASRVGAFEELISDDRTGRLFELNDTRDAVAKICSLLDDPARRARIVDAARGAVAQRYAAPRVVEHYLEVVRAALPAYGASVATGRGQP